ncbi:MAG: hypothetical protein ACK5OX_06720 [Desertimonas sp.]
MNPDRLAALEEERRYLLRSLRDLDREYEAGDVDQPDYATLRDDYTTRAAEVLRTIEAGRETVGRRPRRSWGHTTLVSVAVVAAAALTGWMVARSSGERTAGQTMTGLDPRGDTAVALTEARLLMSQDPVGALQRFDQVLAEDPDHAEALTYRGWLLYTTLGMSGVDGASEEATADARDALARAAEADPAYADPHCFLAIIAARADDDTELARREADTCLDLGPPAAARAMVEQFRSSLDAVPTTAE